MNLYVEMFDGWTAFHESELGCRNPTGCRRVVKLKLTDEQIEQIKPRKTGNNGPTLMYESVNPICFQAD
jgi:hypothetical protein